MRPHKGYSVKKRKYLWGGLIASLVIILICWFSKDVYNMPSALNDEIGYLANAAFFSGYDWNGIMRDIPYYSFGYSLFLVPFFLLFSNGQFIYIGVLCINIICIEIAFICMLYISEKIWKSGAIELKILICMSIVLSAYTVSMSRYALSECMLFAVFCIISVWAIKVITSPTYLNTAVLAFLSVFIFSVHQRALSVMMSSIILIIFLLIIKKIPAKKVVTFFIIFIIAGLGFLIIKNLVQNNVWKGDTEALSNDFSTQISAASLILSVDGIKNLAYSFIGKIFAITTAYFLLPIYFVAVFAKRVFFLIKNKLVDIQNSDIFNLYLFISLLFTIAISAVFCLYPIRQDQVIYTRYNEYIIGPILLSAFSSLYNKKKLSILEAGGCCIIIFVLAFFTNRAMIWMEGNGYISLTTPMLSVFYRNGRINVYIVSVVMILVGGLIYYANIYRHNILNYILISIILVIGIYAGNYTNSIYNKQDEIRKATLEMTEEIREYYNETLSGKIKLALDGETFMQKYYGGLVQAELPQIKAQYVDLNNEIISEKNEGSDILIVFLANESLIDEIDQSWDIFFSNEYYTVFKQ